MYRKSFFFGMITKGLTLTKSPNRSTVVLFLIRPQVTSWLIYFNLGVLKLPLCSSTLPNSTFDAHKKQQISLFIPKSCQKKTRKPLESEKLHLLFLVNPGTPFFLSFFFFFNNGTPCVFLENFCFLGDQNAKSFFSSGEVFGLCQKEKSIEVGS